MNKFKCLKCEYLLICQCPGSIGPADCVEETKELKEGESHDKYKK